MTGPLTTGGRFRPIATAAGQQDGEEAEDGEVEGTRHLPRLVIAISAKQSFRDVDRFASLAMTKKMGLPPVMRSDARLLVLGSLPGEESLRAARYYAHPQNQFWRLLGEVLGEPLATLGYEERLMRLQARGVALWDVIHAARREGSLDGALSAVEARDLRGFVTGLPQLRVVAFNGGTAARLGRKALAGAEWPLVDLPSSSPAYTLPFADKAARWMALRAFLD